jgi:nucleotide-binding universal stress UspA family protein
LNCILGKGLFHFNVFKTRLAMSSSAVAKTCHDELAENLIPNGEIVYSRRFGRSNGSRPQTRSRLLADAAPGADITIKTGGGLVSRLWLSRPFDRDQSLSSEKEAIFHGKFLRELIMDRRILVATDDTEHSRLAVGYAIHLAIVSKAELTIAVVNVALGGARGPVLYSYSDADAKKIAGSAAEKARLAGVKDVHDVVILSREADSGIVEYANEKKIDHIIVGTGDKSGISRLVLGSVAADVARRAHCAVTIAR